MNRQKILPYFILLLLFLSASNDTLKAQCQADSVFETANIISQSWVSPQCLLSRDIDNDGDNDIIFAKVNPQNSKGIYLMYNMDGLGTFGGEILILHSPNNTISSIASEDIDGDNDYDIILNRGGSGGKVEILFNLGDDTFSDPFLVGQDLGSPFNEIEAADIDQDGDIDLIIQLASQDSVKWFKNVDGSGENWEQNDIGSVDDINSILIDDVNADGLIDVIACAGQFTDLIVWFENLGDEVFSEFQFIATDVDTPIDVLFEDIDGDGLKDIIAGDNNGDYICNYKGLGNGTFSARQNISAVNGFRQIMSQDIDCDGDIDIISGGYTGLELHENIESSSSWSTSTITGAEFVYDSVLSGDLNGDGTDDLIFASQINTTIGWYANTCPCSLTSTSNENRISEIKVFPNPTVHSISVEFSQDISIAEAYIYDSSGRMLIRTDKLEASDKIDVQSLSPGHCTLLIMSKDGSAGRKSFVKQ